MSSLACELCAEEGIQIEAFGFCLDCCDHLCEDCYKSHRKLRQTRHHVLLDKEQMLQQKESLPTKDGIKDTCPQHSEETVKYFCVTHDIPGCTVCITTDHRLCEDVVHVPHVSKGIADSEEYREIEVKIDKTTKRFEAIIPAATANIAKSETSTTQVVQAISEFRNDIVATIDRLSNAAQVDAEQSKDTDIQRLNDIIIKSKDGLKKLHTMEAGMKNLERLGRENKLFLAVKTNGKDTKEMQDQLTELENDNTVRICRFESNAKLLKFLRSVDRLGCLSDTVDDTSDFIDSSSTEDAEKSDTAPTCTATHQHHPKASHLRDINVKSANEYSLLCSVKYMAVFEQNKLVVVSKTVDLPQRNESVKVIDTTRNRIVSELVLHRDCYGMVKINEDYLALNISDNGIVLFNVGTILTAYGTLYSWSSNYNISSFDNNIYVCDQSKNQYGIFRNNKKIVKVDMNGFTSDAVVSSEVNKPPRGFNACALYKSKDGETYMYAIVADYTQAWSIYLGHGPINKWITDKVKLPVVPTSIVMSDDRKLLFITTSENDNEVIYILRTGTTDARVLLSKEDGLKNVSSICYCSKKKQLFVAMPSWNFIKVFQLSGVA